MRHFRQWQRKAITSYERLQTGFDKQPHRSTGSTCGSYKNGVHCTSTIAFTLVVPIAAKRYYLCGWLNGHQYWMKWAENEGATCGYVKTERITVRGETYCKLTRKEYKNQLPRIYRGTVGVLKINILWTRIPPTTRLVGGAVPESQLNY